MLAKPIDLIPFMQETHQWLLEGDLGAGKTTLVQKVSKSLGIQDKVTSPTFSIINEYKLENADFPQYQKLIHMDLYRIKSEEELYEIGFESYLVPSNLVFIEWPQIAMQLIEWPFGYIRIKEENKNIRQIFYKLPDNR